MKHLLHKLSSLRLLMLLTVLLGMGSGTAWADTTTYTFTSKSWGATSEGSAANWASGKDGGQFQSGRGVQVSSSVTGANATSPISFTNVTRIVVTYSTNKSSGAGDITLKIGDNNKYPKTVTSSGGTSDRTLEYLYNTKPESGNVQITVNCTTNSIYVKSIAITTSTSTPVTGVSLNKNATTLEVGDTETLTETVAPDNATNKNVSWESDNTDVATVNNGTVTAVAAGTANITVTTEDGSYTATCEVTVNAASKTAVNMTGFNAVETTIIKGNTTTTTVSNDQDGWTASYTYSSNDENIATVDENGVITAVNAGTTNINCALNIDENDENYKAGATTSMSVEITVTNPPYTVTFSDGGSVTEESAGAGVTLPSRSEKAGYAFAGWSETNVSSETTQAPTIIGTSETYYPTANITLYPVYTRTEGGASSESSNVFESGSFSNGVITWTIAEVVTITQEQSNGATAPNSSYVSAPRWYSGNLITITPSVSINSISATANTEGYATTLANSSFSNATASANGTAVTITPIDGNSTITITLGGQSRLSSLTINYGGGTTYYWSSPVAAAVERPEISIADNPFTFSTTATITCETEGAAIKYSFDGETWNNYSEAFTITEGTTIYAKAVKDEDESTVASVTVTKNLVTPTVTVSGELTLDLDGETSVSAGTLTAAVTYEENAVAGATVTWSSSNTDIATINESTGAVTIKATGEVTFTATYAGNGDYAETTGTKTVTVIDSKAPGSEGNPYTVAQAREAIDAGTGITNVYATGIVSEIVTVYSSQYGNISYNISADGLTTSDQLQAYRGKSYNGENFTSADDIQVGDVVVVYGTLKKYNSTYEFDQNNQLVSLVRKPAAPTFSPAAGAVASGTQVTLSTTTQDAVIYYTTDGNEPTTGSSVYSEPISITEATTIKAIAVKDEISSDVATAAYTIAVPVATPTFSPAAGIYNTAQNVTISCATDAAIIYYSYDNESWTEYTEALTIDETKTVYAKAEKQDMAPSAVASAEYQIQIPSIVFDGLDAPTRNFYHEASETNIHFVSEYTTGDLAVVICDSEGNPTTYNWFRAELINGAYVHIGVTQNDDQDNARTAYFKVTADNAESEVFSVVQAKYVADFATLPFNWAGGGKSGLTDLTGVTASGLGSDYAVSNAPYQIKFDTDGDYIQIKTDSQPGTVTVGVKMIGGANSSSITVQQSADGETFTAVETLSISGNSNAELTLETTNAFAASTRYVKLVFNKGSNVGVGPITISKAPPATPTFSVDEGEYSEAKSVEISCDTDGATIYYTTDGTDPDDNSDEYTDAIFITETTTLKAIAIKNEVESAVASATYTMIRPAAPTFNVAECVFDAAFDLQLSTETDGATIYYTTNGSTPTTSSSEYSTEIAISTATTTVKAIAVKDGLTSDVASATYTYDSRTTPTFTLSTTSLDLKVNDASDAVSLTTNSDGDITFSCADDHVTLTGTGNSRTISANAAGEYTVNVSVSGSEVYKDAAGSITVNVTKKATTMAIATTFDNGKDIYTASEGLIEGSVKYNDDALDPQPTVTYSSSNETVATVDEDGIITFVKAGTTTISASYAGNDEYEACINTYDLELIDSTPQETEVVIILNNTFFGCDAFTTWTSGMASTLSESSKKITVTYSKGTSANMYCSADKIRFYTGNTFTIDAPAGYHIVNINMGVSISSADPEGEISNTTWTGDAASVSFTFANKADLTSITVTLAETVTVGGAGYTTYVTKHNISFPEGVTAYIATAVNTGTIHLEEVMDAPAGTPLVIKAEPNTYTLERDYAGLYDEIVASTPNLLKSSDGKVEGNQTTIYALGKKSDVVGFYLVKNGAKVPAGKAYLEVDDSGSVKEFLTFDFDGGTTTGIESVKSDLQGDEIFNLAGQKMNKLLRGVNIVNGKKVLVK